MRLHFLVGAPQRASRSLEQGFCRVEPAVEYARDFGDAQPIQVPKRQRGAVVRTDAFERPQRQLDIGRFGPRISDVIHSPSV